MSNSTALTASRERLSMEVLVRPVGEIGAQRKGARARGGRDVSPGAPCRGRVAPVQFGRDERDLLARGKMPLDRRGRNPVALEAIEPDADCAIVERGRRLIFAVAAGKRAGPS